MWEWLNANSGALALFINLGTLLVWLLYLQIFLQGYKRRRRCRILVNFGGGETVGARCLICNMSEEPIYVMSLVAAVTTAAGGWRRPITDYELDESTLPPQDSTNVTRQGPLRVGDCRDVGSFSDLIERARHAHGEWEPADSLSHDHVPTEVKLVVVAIYGSEDLPVAAERTFKLIYEDGRQCLRPLTVDTQQIRGRRARRRLYEHLADYV